MSSKISNINKHHKFTNEQTFALQRTKPYLISLS